MLANCNMYTRALRKRVDVISCVLGVPVVLVAVITMLFAVATDAPPGSHAVQAFNLQFLFLVSGAGLLYGTCAWLTGLIEAAGGAPSAGAIWPTGIRRIVVRLGCMLRTVGAAWPFSALAFLWFAVLPTFTHIPTHLAIGWSPSTHPQIS